MTIEDSTVDHTYNRLVLWWSQVRWWKYLVAAGTVGVVVSVLRLASISSEGIVVLSTSTPLARARSTSPRPRGSAGPSR